MISRVRASCSGRCCGIRLRPASTNELISDGVTQEKYNNAVNMAIKTSFTFPIWKAFWEKLVNSTFTSGWAVVSRDDVDGESHF